MFRSYSNKYIIYCKNNVNRLQYKKMGHKTIYNFLLFSAFYSMCMTFCHELRQ